MKSPGRKKSRRSRSRVLEFVAGMSLAFDFTGQRALDLYPEAFDSSANTIASAWKEVGQHLSNAMGQTEG